MPPSLFVVFWATGDLMRRKLARALSVLRKGNPNLSVLAVGRKPMTSEEYREFLRSSAEAPKEGYSEEFLASIEYLAIPLDDPAAFEPLSEYVRARNPKTLAFYLSVPPELFAPIAEGIGRAWLNAEPARIAFEKPFGQNLASASDLNARVRKVFSEDQIFRIDHYVGKKAIQDILAFRFSNALFEPVWNHHYVDHIQITASESLWIEGRGGYYDSSGALRDMVQNHLFQVLSLVMMEPPHSLDAHAVHDEKAKAIRSLRLKAKDAHVVFGQYRGYGNETGVGKGSNTETFAAMRLEIDNWRFKGVPVYLRTGKALAEKRTHVVVEFKKPPFSLYRESEGTSPNRITFEVSPREGISVGFNVRNKGDGYSVRSVKSEFVHPEESPEAYERILADLLSWDHTLFTRWDMVEESWKLVDELVGCKDDCPVLHPYDAGSRGPEAADGVPAVDGRTWI